MNLEEMKKKKKELGYTAEQIADISGVPLGTVQKIFSGVTSAPRYDTLRALEKAFKESPGVFVRERGTPYQIKRPGQYTLGDYLALPDEHRVEMIDGAFYDMSSPIAEHQLIAGQIYAQLNEYIRKKKGMCIPFISPMDVRLDCDDKTVVQPDVMVVCDRNKILTSYISGAPDFVAEILSQSSKRKDMFLKLEKYVNAGVREYWMIDSDKMKVIVYDFENDDYPVIYGFDAKIPVKIFGEECRIDFTKICNHIRFLYER